MQKVTAQWLIEAEYQRLMEHQAWLQGFDANTLEMAALCYRDAQAFEKKCSEQWPFMREYWMPESRKTNLARAGAIYRIAADCAEKKADYDSRNNLREHVESCAILLNSII